MEPKKIRHYDLDWLRVIAIIILLFFHTGMLFVSWDFHLKNSETSKIFEYIMGWLHQWRMPLLLFISGAGTYFALGFRTSKKFIKERRKRLLIPLIFGMLIVVPPQIYFEKINQFISFFDFYPTIFKFVPYPEGNTSWHHLWFIAYLFLYSIIGLPVFLYLRKDKSIKIRDWINKLLSKKGGFLFLTFPMIISQFLLRPFFPTETHALMDDWAFFTLYFLFFLFGYIIYCDKRNWSQLKMQRHINFFIALISTILYYLAWLIPYKMNFYGFDFIYGVPAILTAWFWLITIIGYGQKYLNKNSKALAYANEAIYPFYILHQTAIIIIAYFVIQWSMGIFAKFLIISIFSLISSMIFYEFLIKPFNICRVLFGMKKKKIVDVKLKLNPKKLILGIKND